VFGTNGLAIAGRQLYASVTLDLTSPVVRVPLDAPGTHTTVAQLSAFPTVYKGLDDLEAVGDTLVVAANLAGELVRVDPGTGRSCVLVRGLITPTSVRRPVGFGSADPARELFVTEASGRILRVRLG
jgi:hypothetical protein